MNTFHVIENERKKQKQMKIIRHLIFSAKFVVVAAADAIQLDQWLWCKTRGALFRVVFFINKTSNICLVL